MRNKFYFILTVVFLLLIVSVSSINSIESLSTIENTVENNKTTFSNSNSQHKEEPEKELEELEKELMPTNIKNTNEKQPVKNTEQESKYEENSIDYWIDKLSFLKHPIKNVQVSNVDSHLPNALRSYRNGYHEGIDYFYDSHGQPIAFGEPVFASGKGMVIRIDHDYAEPTVEKRNEMLTVARRENDTPRDVLDILRGKQVWIRHENNIVTRYAHLNKVCNDLNLGDPVYSGQYIGEIGNSGTSKGAKSLHGGAHLHFEIWINGQYFGHELKPNEIRTILSEAL